MPEIRPATAWDAEQLAATMRPEDAAEVEAAAGFSPLEALLCSMRVSSLAYTVELNGEVAAIWGVAPMGAEGSGAAALWALTGRAVDRYPVLVGIYSVTVVQQLARRYPLLFNMVDARYQKALRWIRWLGFTVHPARPFGPRGLPFHPISLRGSHV